MTEPPLTGAAFELNPGSGPQEPAPEEEQGLTGAASVLNPGSQTTADEQEEGGAPEPASLVSSAVVVNVEEDEVRPLSSALLSDKAGCEATSGWR